ncbi:MAG: aldo/keto reductase, partial [Spirochaetaceae bacterium]|nr:aldo/keto reductase [Spirochaetaceae bacterium]
MNYRIFPKIPDCQISVLGFGLMRLPLLLNSEEIDKEKTRNLVKLAIDQGINYFDTAYPYHHGKSEIVFGEIVKEENLRDKIYIADKMPVWDVKKEEDFYRILDEQLNKLQTDYIDFYLLHAMDAERWEKVKNLNVTKFLENAKSSGKIRHIGFSFHDNFDAFKKMCDEYSGFEFCQLQY